MENMKKVVAFLVLLLIGCIGQTPESVPVEPATSSVDGIIADLEGLP